jgi:spermidine/putrescine transport system permease protein
MSKPPNEALKQRSPLIRGGLLLPSSAMLLFLSIFPLAMLVFFSFVEGNLTAPGIKGFTLGNFIEMFSGLTFSNLIKKSLRIALTVSAACTAIAYPAAWGIAKVVHEKWRNMLVMLAVVPFFTSQLLLIYAIMVALQARGVVMSFLGFLGMVDPASSILYTNTAVILILIYEYLPYMLLCLYAAMEKIDTSVIEASRSLGAKKSRTFFSIVLPQTIPGLLAGFLLIFVPVAGSFVEPNIAGGPNGMMIGSLINSQFNVVLNMGYGSALSLVFLLVMSGIIALVNGGAWLIRRHTGGREG